MEFLFERVERIENSLGNLEDLQQRNKIDNNSKTENENLGPTNLVERIKEVKQNLKMFEQIPNFESALRNCLSICLIS